MQKLSDRLKELYIGDKTHVTLHDLHIRSSEPDSLDMRYITSAGGVVKLLTFEFNQKDQTLKATLDVKLFPFPSHARRNLPLFRYMVADPEHADRTIFTDSENNVFGRIVHTFDVTKDYVMFPSVSTGCKCKDSCRRKCLMHQIPTPYVFVKTLN